ncbi:MAG TPA: HD domain-containing phosphohydrolase, partial [Solirubrobacterales bacterium]|nr:HD domain-containing phosphohydrolase [Solirubrobacterales bacterium]
VDDRPEVLRLIERALSGSFRCDCATGAVEARALLSRRRFDLALCDIEMPGESGLELAEEIAAEHSGTAVVLVTGVDDPEVARRAFDFGTHGYLVKPFWPGQLLITAMNALCRRDLERAQQAHAKALEDRLQDLMDWAPVPVYIKDLDRRYLLANRVAHEVAGLEPNELIGLSDSDIMPPAAARLVAESDRRILAGGEAVQIEETLEVGGEERTFFSVKFPYVDDAGHIAGISGISTDITGKKQAEALREELALAQERAIVELRVSRQETVERLSRAIDRRDPDTGEHVNRMAQVAAFLGSRYGLDSEQVLLLRAAAPMHDVGKIAMPDAVLQKSGPLTEAEREVMESHAAVGHEILAGSESALLKMAAQIALTHHERWNGGGYPRGLRGEEIPLEGRIVAVADVFDALLSDRVYRPALPLAEATEVIRRGRGTDFDPVVADLLLDNLDEALALRG